MKRDLHASCPYRKTEPEANWRKVMASCDGGEFEPTVERPFTIAKSDWIATAGSCFAQNIARYLKSSGYRYLVTERAPRGFPKAITEDYNYGTFTARYANIYTTRQMMQLGQRAFGSFKPADSVWDMGDYVIDPFRPFIQPGGWSTEKELLIDREFHLFSVRQMMRRLNVFVFTLGLTECWEDKKDGAIYGACPGCGAGTHDPQRHGFVNLGVKEVVRDFTRFLHLLKQVNKDARVILTVSPVPLIATMEPRHVLTSTIYSKSVLRVAAEQLQQAHPNVSYFPSYEIVSAPFHGNSYYEADRRNVTTEAVDHVMRVFFKHYVGEGAGRVAKRAAAPKPAAAAALSEEVNRIICDEEMLDA